MKKNLKIISDIAYWLVIVLLACVAAGTALSVSNVPLGFKLYSVLSGSMEPELPVGSIVAVQKQTAYIAGDIITFVSASDMSKTETPTTHRITKVSANQSGAPEYITRGDANNAKDLEPVSFDRVLGKVVFHLPLVGFAISFARSTFGFVLLIIIPATLIIASELQVIVKEAKKIRTKKS